MPRPVDLYASREVLRHIGVELVKAVDETTDAKPEVRLEFGCSLHGEETKLVIGNDDMENLPDDSTVRELVIVDLDARRDG